MLTEWKHSGELACLNEVSSVPLQQALRHLQDTFTSLWENRSRSPRFKCDWYGRDLIVIDRWYPSSKTCSACGHTAASVPLNVREWDCANCGARHDRDINAARNIRAARLAVSACGGGVRPRRETSRAGSSP